MIKLLTGENSFEIEAELKAITYNSKLKPEKIDGSTLDVKDLPDLLTGSTLFANKRLVIIKNLSENTQIWTDFADWIPRISNDIDLVLVEARPDKRTRTYKELQKAGLVKESVLWTDRDVARASQWIAETAKQKDIELNKKCVQLLIDRIGLDQWQLWHAIEKLSLLNSIDEETIKNVIDISPTENVFNLLESALRSDKISIQRIIRVLENSEDPYRLFGLLSGQVYQLALLAVSSKTPSTAAGDIGAHPYALSRLAPYAKKLGRVGSRKAISYFADTDNDMKLSASDPWLLIERALLNVASI